MTNPLHVCSATWTNQDGSEDKPSLAYDPARNVLTFAGQYTPTEYLVVRASLFLMRCTG